MPSEPTALTADGIQYSGDAMADIVLHHIPHKERGEIDTNDRIYQIEPVGCATVKRTGEKQHYLVDETVQDKSSHGSKKTYHKRKYQHKHFLADMLFPPLQYSV